MSERETKLQIWIPVFLPEKRSRHDAKLKYIMS